MVAEAVEQVEFYKGKARLIILLLRPGKLDSALDDGRGVIYPSLNFILLLWHLTAEQPSKSCNDCPTKILDRYSIFWCCSLITSWCTVFLNGEFAASIEPAVSIQVKITASLVKRDHGGNEDQYIPPSFKCTYVSDSASSN